MNELKQKYSEAIRWLDDNWAYFVTDILNIGRPKIENSIPTAAVSLADENGRIDPKGKDFTFLFNAEYLKTQSAEDNGWTLAHETMHILLNHLKLAQSSKFDDHQRWNIAADCVINDYLHDSLGFHKKEGRCYGENYPEIGHSTSSMTVREVYDLLPESPPCEGGCSGIHVPGGTPGAQPCDGSCGAKHKYADDQEDDHGWLHGATKDEQDKAENASNGGQDLPADLQRKKDDDDFKSALPPGSGVGSKATFTENNEIGFRWPLLLEEINPFAFKRGPRPRASWHRRPRKLGALPADIMLPVHKEGRDGEVARTKPALVMALDTSGSIGQEQANQFVNMARSVNQLNGKIKLFVCTFTTQYMELDLEDPVWNDGGTHFDCITSYIENVVMPQNKKRYPSAVVVVTDGMAWFDSKSPQADQEKNWWWLLTSTRTTDSRGNAFPGTLKKLADYAKGVK